PGPSVNVIFSAFDTLCTTRASITCMGETLASIGSAVRHNPCPIELPPMVDIHHEGSCAAPLDVAFAYLDDYRNATTWMFGLAEFKPAGAKDQGLGAEFAGTFQ